MPRHKELRNRGIFLCAIDTSSKMLINLHVRDAMQSQQRSQADILLYNPSCCLLYVGRDFHAFAFELPQALFRVLQVLFSPCARTPLIVADAGKILYSFVSDRYGRGLVAGNLRRLTLQARRTSDCGMETSNSRMSLLSGDWLQ